MRLLVGVRGECGGANGAKGGIKRSVRRWDAWAGLCSGSREDEERRSCTRKMK